ncbi:DUF4167 domain-containing protein [Pacificimonas flava]|nr:DUF4167 domain-containing protein [Pacificimonas flava]
MRIETKPMRNPQSGRRRRSGRSNSGGMPQNQQRQRGNANQLLEKYKNMARDAAQAGERVQAEYYLQFADHYFRVVADMQARKEEQQGAKRRGRGGNDADDDDDEDEDDDDSSENSRQDRGRGRNTARKGRGGRQEQGRDENRDDDEDDSEGDGDDDAEEEEAQEERPKPRRRQRRPRADSDQREAVDA